MGGPRVVVVMSGSDSAGKGEGLEKEEKEDRAGVFGRWGVRGEGHGTVTA